MFFKFYFQLTIIKISHKYFNILPGYKVLCVNMKDYFILDLDPFPSLSLPAYPFSELSESDSLDLKNPGFRAYL